MNPQLDDKYKAIQITLQSAYEKDDVFMASQRRENEEKANFIKLLQTNIEQLNTDR